MYKKEFPEKCWPMKHFRNYGIADQATKKKKMRETLIAEFLSSEEEGDDERPKVIGRVRRTYARYGANTQKASTESFSLSKEPVVEAQVFNISSKKLYDEFRSKTQKQAEQLKQDNLFNKNNELFDLDLKDPKFDEFI